MRVTIGSLPLLLFGTDAQRERWLRPLAEGRALGAFALTEPDAGSDARGIRTRAEPLGWRIIVGDFKDLEPDQVFGTLFQYPGVTGRFHDFSEVITQLHEAKAIAVEADARLVGKPDFYVAGIDAFLLRDGLQTGGETFLKSAIAPSAYA